MVKQDVFRAVPEVCILTYVQLCECKFVTIFLFCDFFSFPSRGQHEFIWC